MVRRVLIAVVVLVVVAVAIDLARRGDPVDPPDVPGAGPTTPVRSESLEGGSQPGRESVAPVVGEPPSGAWVVKVVDRRGMPVSGAVIYEARPWAPFVDGGVIATTGIDGTAAVKRESLDPAALLVAARRGYQAGQVDVEAEEPVVVLDEGRTWQIRCVDELQQPLAGVVVSVALTGTPTSFVSDAITSRVAGHEVLPGADPDRTVHVAMSGQDGVATFAGLPSGQCFVRTRHPTKVLLQQLGPHVSTKGIPVESNLTLVFCDVCAAILEPPEGEAFVSYGGRFRKGQFERDTVVNVSRWDRQLRAEHPGAAVVVNVAARELRVEGGRPVTSFWFLMSRSGWVEREIEFAPVGEAVPVRLPATPGDGAACVATRLRCDPPLPVPQDFRRPAFLVTCQDCDRHLEQVVTLDEATFLPPGRYRIAPLSRLVGSALQVPPSFEVVAGEECDVTMERTSDLVPVELTFEGPHGMPVPRLRDVTLNQMGVQSGAYQRWRAWDPRDEGHVLGISSYQWVLAGRLEVLVTVPGLGDTQGLFDVEPGEGAVALRVALPDGR